MVRPLCSLAVGKVEPKSQLWRSPPAVPFRAKPPGNSHEADLITSDLSSGYKIHAGVAKEA